MAHGVRNLHKQANGIYHAIFKRDGKQYWISLQTRSLKEARRRLRTERERFLREVEGNHSGSDSVSDLAQLQKQLAEMRVEMARLQAQLGSSTGPVLSSQMAVGHYLKEGGGPLPTPTMSFSDTVKRHFSTMTFASRKTETMYSCQRNLLLRLCQDWKDFTPATLWSLSRTGKGRRRPTGNSSLNHFRLYLCTFAEWCQDQGFLTEQVVKEARKIIRLKVNPREPVIPPPESMAIVLAQVEQEDRILGRFCRFMAYTASRLGSALAAEWSEIDWAKSKINLRLKGSTRKEIFLHPKAVELLRTMQLEQTENILLRRIFPLDDGDVRRARILLRKWAVALGVQINIPHLLRHYHASRLVAQGVDIASVSAQLCHRNIATTLKAYVHVIPSQTQCQLNAAAL